MAIQVTGTLDVKPLLDTMQKLGKATSRTAMRRSLTKSKNTLQTTARRETQKSLNLTVSGFKRATKTRTELHDLSAQVDIIGKPIPLIDFKGTREVKRGVSIQVKPGGKRSIFRHAFIATTDSGHRGVFERDLKKVKKRKAPKWSGLSIREKVGPQVVQALNRARTKLRIMKAGQAAFQAELQRQVDLAVQYQPRRR